MLRRKRGPDELLSAAGIVPSMMTIDQEAKKARLDSTAVYSQLLQQQMPSMHMNGYGATLLAGTPYTQLGYEPDISHYTGAPIAQASVSSSTRDRDRDREGPPAPPSRVVHLRNIPGDMVDVEVIQLCVAYGKITNYMLLKGKNQAFVEYEDLESATTIVNTLAAIPIQVRGRTIFAQFSTHQELKTEKRAPPQPALSHAGSDDSPGCRASSGSVKRVLECEEESGRLLEKRSRTVPIALSTPLIGMATQVDHFLDFSQPVRPEQVQALNSLGGSSLDVSGGTQQAPNAVLRVIIENMIYPVTLDVLHSIFSRYGKVLRIITFNKNNTFQALVQLSEATAAQTAKQQLENQNVYNGCCTLRIDYSKLSTLNVKYNNDKSRDYTNPSLPSGELTIEQQLSLAASGQLPGGLQSLVPSPFAFPFGANPATTFMPNSLDSLGSQGLSAFMPLGLGQQLQGAAGLRFPVAALAVTSVVLVSNLDENAVSPDCLFTLFGVYGDVIRVKILFNKKDNALIQYSEPQQAQLAIQHLDKIRWHDKVIRVTASKHNNVQLPKEGQPDAGLTRDYSHSTLHRFKKPGSKNYMNIYPPSSTLHLSNIPPSVGEQNLLEAFTDAGYAVKAFKFFPKDHKMALCQLDDVETAIDALIRMHNHKLAENSHLRVSFSKSGI